MKRRMEMTMSKWMIGVLAMGLFAGAVKSEAQAVPIPIAVTPPTSISTTYCAANIPVYQKPGAAYGGESEGDGCPASQAYILGPTATAIDGYGNIYIADYGHYTLRVIYKGGAALAQAIVNAQATPTTLTVNNLVPGNVYLLAGSYTVNAGTTSVVAPTSPYYCNQVSGAVANVSTGLLVGCPGGYTYGHPNSIALDGDGNVFYGVTGSRSAIVVFYVGGAKAAALILANNTNLKTVTPGYTYLIGGFSSATAGYTADGSTASNTLMIYPRNMVIDANENITYTDTENNLVRKINGTTGIVTTLAGSCTLTVAGSSSGPSSLPYCETAQQLGLTTPLAQGDGGPALSAHFNYPYAVAYDQYGNLFIADSASNENTTTTPATPAGAIYGRVRVVYAGGTLPGIVAPVVGNIYTYAGGGTLTTSTNVQAQLVEFDNVDGITIDPSGYLYVTDKRNTLSTASNHIWRIDPVTGIATIIVGNSGARNASTTFPVRCKGTTGPSYTDIYYSGCPATMSPFSALGNFILDKQGNAYITDNGYELLRPYNWDTTFPTTTVGSSSTQYLVFDMPAGTVTTGLTFTVDGVASTEFSDVGGTSDSCAAAATYTTDTVCSFLVSFTPAKVGQRLGTIQVMSATGPIGTQYLNGTGSAGEVSIDPGTSGTLGTGITPGGVAVDLQGNAYISDDKGNQVLKVPVGGGTTTTLITGLSGPRQIAVDGLGTVYVADTGNNRIVRRTAAGVQTNLGTGLKAPTGVAVDILGNAYVADTGNGRIVVFGATTQAQTTLYTTGVVTPASLSIDANSNLYVVDSANKVITIQSTLLQGQIGSVTVPTGATPVAVSVDLAGNTYILDSANEQVTEISPTSTSTTLIAQLTTPTGMAVDVAGDVYVADSGNTSVISLNRTTGSVTFPQTDIKSSSFPTSPLTLTSEGNLPATLSTPLFTETNATVFPVVAATTNGCSNSEVLALGTTCQETATFHPTATGSQSSLVTFPTTNGNTVIANLNGTAVNLILTQVALSSVPVSPLTIGQSVTVTAVVSHMTGTLTPTGTITFVVDGLTQKPSQPFGTGTVTLTLPSLTVGTHTVVANYSGDTVYSPGSSQISIVVTKIPTTTSLTETQANGGPIFASAITPTTSNGLTATGTIAITIDGAGVPGSPFPVGSATTSPITTLTNGPHTVVATYSGDGNFATSTKTLAITIAKVTTTTSVIETQASGGPDFTATVSPMTANGLTATGTVSFSIDGGAATTYAVGAAVLGPVNVADGPHTLVVTYSGDSNFASSATTLPFTIAKVGTSIVNGPPTNANPNGTFQFDGSGGWFFTLVLQPSSIFTPNGVPLYPTGTLSVNIYSYNPTTSNPASTPITLISTTNGIKTNTVGTFVLNANGTYTYTYNSAVYDDLQADSTSTLAYYFSFTYTGDGNYEAVTYNPTLANPGNAPTQPVTVVHLPTTTTVTAALGVGGTVINGTVSYATGNFEPTGTVAIYRDGSTAALYTYTLVPTTTAATSVTPLPFTYVDTTAADGPHTYTATYSGDGNFAKSTSAASAPVQTLHHASAVALTISGGGNAGVPGIALTATVSSAYTTFAAAGTATFTNNGVTIGTANVVNGVALFVTPSLTYPIYTFCVTYNGDGNYLPSGPTCASEGSDLAIAPSATTLVVPEGAQAAITITLGSINGYSGTLTPSCSGLPQNTLCRFNNVNLTGPTVTVSQGVEPQETLQIYSNVNPQLASAEHERHELFLASMIAWPVALAMFWMARRSGRRKLFSALMGLALLVAISGALSGCGSGTASGPGNNGAATYTTPLGTSNVTVTYTDATGFSRSTVIAVTIAAATQPQ